MPTVWCPTSVTAAAAAAIEEAETAAAWLSLARGNWIARGCNSTELEECWAAGGIRRFQPAAIKQRNDAWNSSEEKKTEAVGGGRWAVGWEEGDCKEEGETSQIQGGASWGRHARDVKIEINVVWSGKINK